MAHSGLMSALGAEGARLLPKDLDLVTRDIVAADVDHVVEDWTRGYVDDFHNRAHADRGRALDEYRPYAMRQVSTGPVEIAALSEAPDAVIAWRCWARASWQGRRVLHFVFVKPKFRRAGVFRWFMAELIPEPLIYTHETRIAQHRLHLPKEWEYRPLLKHL